MHQHQISLSANATGKLIYVGAEKTPVIIIDDLISDVNVVVDHVSRNVNFSLEQQTYYPGFRAAIFDEYHTFILNAVLPELIKNFKLPLACRSKLRASFYSLVTTPPDQLTLPQRRPHADTTRPFYFAIMHYLGAGHHGGTGFFRHKQTGFETISEERADEYSQLVNESDKRLGNSVGTYITSSNDQFELIGTIEYKQNRVVIYPGYLLHSALINPETDIIADAQTGRLTANLFLEFIA